MAVTLTANEFFTGMTNLALVVRTYPMNTSRKVKSFVDSFATETLSGGNTKIFPFVDVPDVDDYSETSSLLTVSKPTNTEQYLQTNYKKVIPISYSPYILAAAFTSDSGMNDFVGYILGLSESARDNFLMTEIIDSLVNLTTTAATSSAQTISVINADALSTYVERNAAALYNQTAIVKAMQTHIRNMTGVFNSNYNELKYNQALDLSDLRLVMFDPWAIDLDLKLNAMIFGREYLNEVFERPEEITVPQLAVPASPATNANIIAIAMHKYRVQHFYQFEARGDFMDWSNLSINDFLHIWGAVGEVTGFPACKFTANITQPSAG